MRKLTKEQKRDIRVIAAKRDEDIDFSDAPAVLDWSGAEIGKFNRPVTMRLDSDVIAWLKADGQSQLASATCYDSFQERKEYFQPRESRPTGWQSQPPKGKSLIFIWYLNLFLEPLSIARHPYRRIGLYLPRLLFPQRQASHREKLVK